MQGRIEVIECDDYALTNKNNFNFVAAYIGEDVIVIPWNRVKQIQVINKKNESEEI